jgi:thiol-disulfide isomerase/thioredoxin
LTAVLAASFGATLTATGADSDDVKLEALNWNAFTARLAKAGSQHYKYTLVDAWATTCGPCKENFPHLVEMHQKYGGKGLQVVSLSLDDTTDTKAVAAAREFLREKKAGFLNVLLDEEFGVGFEKLDINAIPAVFVYGPDGKLVKKYTMDDPKNQFTYEQVEKDVSALLAGKTASR